MSRPAVRLRAADSPAFRDQVEALYREYLSFLDLPKLPANWRVELARFPGIYGPPEGRFLLAYRDEELAGCAGLRKVDHERCELKRVFVLQESRRQGVGRALVTALVREARSAGYRTMCIATMSSLHAALALYRDLGFEPAPPPEDASHPDDMYLQLDLAPDVSLREVTEADLPVLFEHQRDPEACRMAAVPSRDRETFTAHWRDNILGEDSVVKRTILADGRVAGNVVSWKADGRPLVGYWIGRELWGRGVATAALAAFAGEIRERPLFARVAEGNAASRRVLEKCGFVQIEWLDPSPEDGVVELVMRLDA